jgi:hypothetical protein
MYCILPKTKLAFCLLPRYYAIIIKKKNVNKILYFIIIKKKKFWTINFSMYKILKITIKMMIYNIEKKNEILNNIKHL